MPWNGSGQFTRNYSWVNDAANNINITASRVDNDTNDIVGNGLNNCITRDGQGGPVANLPMNGFRHTGASNGVNPQDYATINQISSLAPLASPTFTGIPLVPTATAGTNTTQAASCAFVATSLASYLPLSGGTVTNKITTNMGSLGTSAGSFLVPAIMEVTDTNSDQIVFEAFRLNSGSSWTGVIKYIYSRVDSTIQGVIQFNDGNGNANYAMGLGYQTPSLTVNTANGWTFSENVLVNGGLYAAAGFNYGGVTQPHIFVQSSTPTAIAVGDLWFF